MAAFKKTKFGGLLALAAGLMFGAVSVHAANIYRVPAQGVSSAVPPTAPLVLNAAYGNYTSYTATSITASVVQYSTAGFGMDTQAGKTSGKWYFEAYSRQGSNYAGAATAADPNKTSVVPLYNMYTWGVVTVDLSSPTDIAIKRINCSNGEQTSASMARTNSATVYPVIGAAYSSSNQLPYYSGGSGITDINTDPANLRCTAPAGFTLWSK